MHRDYLHYLYCLAGVPAYIELHEKTRMEKTQIPQNLRKLTVENYCSSIVLLFLAFYAIKFKNYSVIASLP